MIKEISAKTLLAAVKQPDDWFGLKYSMNLYRGCQHQCIYCDSRSACYQIEDFRDILIKANAITLLKSELQRKRVKGTIGTGSMNDPYMPIEADQNLTGRALAVIAEHRFPVHIITKSHLVLKDLGTLRQINQVYAAVSFTITTADDDLGKKLEPGASPVSQRFAALSTLAANGILTGVTLMPVLPFLEDTEANIQAIVKRARENGAKYVLASFGVTLRDRQRAYYYTQLDRLFPGLRRTYEQRFGERYFCPSPHTMHLKQVFQETCEHYGIATRMPCYKQPVSEQPLLF
jgi:DNA repair photolyase